MTDRTTVFHPFSQVIINFTLSAFSSQFWYSENGIQSYLNALEKKFDDNFMSPQLNDQKEKVYFMLKFLGNHMIKAQLAIKMNSSFYSTLFRETDWVSPITIQRFSWNLSLFLNWLEILLTKIYQFERHFIPLVHFKVRSKVVSAIQTMYNKLIEAKFLTKSCIIIAEIMIRRENHDSGRCYEARSLLRSTIPTLAHYMNFFQEDTYNILDIILKSGWNKNERDYGECFDVVEVRIKNDIEAWNTVPDIEPYYNTNFRSTSFWIISGDWPNITDGHEHFMTVYEMLKSYKIGSTVTIPIYNGPYNFELFNLRAKDLKFGEMFDTPADWKFGFISMVLNLLVEDEWIATDLRDNFWPRFDLLYNIDFIKAEINKGYKDSKEVGIHHIKQLENYGNVYYILASILGDTWKCNIAEQ
ncbi:hypothetical protein L9F63_014481, partial [Diploptera punctata]